MSSTNFTWSILEYFVSFNLAKNLSFLMFPIKPFPNVTFHKSFHKSFHNLFTSHSTNFTWSILEYFVSFNLAKNLSFLMFSIKPFSNVTFHKSFHKSFHNLLTNHSTNFTRFILEYFVSFNLAKNLSLLVFPIKPFSNVTFL